MIANPFHPSRTGHDAAPHDKMGMESRLSQPFSRALDMSELAKQIIRQQWPLRHHADPRQRGQARSLIRTHVILLRKWQTFPELVN